MDVILRRKKSYTGQYRAISEERSSTQDIPQSVHRGLPEIFTAQHLCYSSTGDQVLPTQLLPREAEDFPRAGKYPKDLPLLTFLA